MVHLLSVALVVVAVVKDIKEHLVGVCTAHSGASLTWFSMMERLDYRWSIVWYDTNNTNAGWEKYTTCPTRNLSIFAPNARWYGTGTKRS